MPSLHLRPALCAFVLSAMFTSVVWSQPAAKTEPAPALGSNPAHEKLKQEAEKAYQESDFTECVELANKVLTENPNDHVALYLRASARVEFGQSQRNVVEIRGGIEDSRRALQLGGSDKINYYLPYLYGMTALAHIEGRKDHSEVVIKVADSVLARPNLNGDDKANILYQRASANVALQNFEVAAKDYTSAIQAAPKHLGCRIGLAECYAMAGNAEKALESFSAAVKEFPENPLVFNNRGMFQQGQGKFAEARADFTKAVELDPQFAVAMTNRGFAWLSEGDAEKAEADFTAAIKVAPQEPMFYSLRASSRLSKGDPKGAIEDYQQVLMVQPENPIAHADLAFAKYFAADYAGATESFDKAVSMEGSLKYLDPWRFWAMTKAGKLNDAVAKYKKDAEAVAADKREWKDNLLLFLVGTISEQDLVGAIAKDGALKTAQQCEAFYFMGERRGFTGDKANAAAFYKQALATKAMHLSAYRGSMYSTGGFATK